MFVITAIAVVALVVVRRSAMIPKFDAVATSPTSRPTDAAGRERLPAVRLRRACWPRSSTASGSSSRSRACRWPPRRRATRSATCRAGIIAGMLVLLVFAALILFTAPGGAGSEAIRTPTTRCPLAVARGATAATTSSRDFVNYVGLAGLVASFFSIIFAYSRQLFALSRAGYLPRFLSVTSGAQDAVPRADRARRRSASCSRRSPRTARTLINIAVFGATVSYVLMMLSHIVLRRREPDLERPVPDAGRRRRPPASACVLAVRRRGGHVLRRREGGRHHRRRLRRRSRLLLVLQPPPPGGGRSGGGVRGDRAGRGGAGRQLRRDARRATEGGRRRHGRHRAAGASPTWRAGFRASA